MSPPSPRSVSTGRAANAAVLVIVALLVCWSVHISLPRPGYQAQASIRWNDARMNPVVPMADMDGDGLPDVEEVYPNPPIHRQDIDYDGMLDIWETRWAEIDPVTGERSVYGLDPTDAIEDPDGDGYDFDGNGRIDLSSDGLFFTYTGMPRSPEYATVPIGDLVATPEIYDGCQVCLVGVLVADNGTYPEGNGSRPGSEIMLIVRLNSREYTVPRLVVELRPFCTRPTALSADGWESHEIISRGSKVDVRGIFRNEVGAPYIEVRGTEGFTNLMEFRSRFYVGDPQIHPIEREEFDLYNETDPMDPDTDKDGMTDGWEARYGEWHRDAETRALVWVWPIDPTYAGDAGRDPDGDGWSNLEEFEQGTSPIDPGSHP